MDVHSKIIQNGINQLYVIHNKLKLEILLLIIQHHMINMLIMH